MAKPKLITKALSVDVLVLDGGTQSRVAISEITVEEYTEILASSDKRWPFPALDVFYDGDRYFVADGFHRALAARRYKRASVPCIIHQGTAWDALLYGMGSNQEHGLRPTQADKRHSVELLLDSGKKLKQKEISDIVGVDARTVQRIVAERRDSEQTPENQTMSGSSGKSGKSDDPFDDEVDPFGIFEGEEEDRTESEGQDAHQQERAPRPPRNGKDAPGGPSKRTPAEEFKVQRSKSVKTAEALMRAFDDLNDLRKSRDHERTITDCQALIIRAQNWK